MVSWILLLKRWTNWCIWIDKTSLEKVTTLFKESDQPNLPILSHYIGYGQSKPKDGSSNECQLKCTLSCDAPCDSYFEENGQCNYLSLAETDSKTKPKTYIPRTLPLPKQKIQSSTNLSEMLKNSIETYLKDQKPEDQKCDGNEKLIKVPAKDPLTLNKDKDTKCTFAFENPEKKTVTITVKKGFKVS